MKIRQEEATEDTVISTQSLVDVMFILVIFFLVTMSFKEIERDTAVNLPQTDTTLSSTSKALVINVKKDGNYFVGGKRLNIDGIKEKLLSLLEKNPSQKVLIRGDKEALHGQVAAVIAVSKKCGVKDANIGYVTTSL